MNKTRVSGKDARKIEHTHTHQSEYIKNDMTRGDMVDLSLSH